jgi:DNA-binding response OmpR family regulator
MPGLHGPELLIQMREHLRINCPVIFITSMDSSENIAQGLELGADDYVVKPLVKQVLLARVRAVMRRYDGPVVGKGSVLQEGLYKLDLKSRVLTLDGSPVHLTPKEFDLAWLLFSNFEQFLPKREALARVWGKDAEIETHTLAQHVYALKKKLKMKEQGYTISAVYGTGYRLEKEMIAVGT